MDDRAEPPLLRFALVRIESLDAPLDGASISRARRLVAADGTLELVERVSLRTWATDPWGRLDSDLDAAERRLTALLDAAPVGSRAEAVGDDDELPEPDEPSLLVLDGGSWIGRLVRAEAALRAGWAVLRWGPLPPTSLYLVLPDGARSTQMRTLAYVLPATCTPTVLVPPAPEEDPPYARLLGVAGVTLRAFSESPGAAEPDLEEALGPSPGLVVIVLAARASTLLLTLGVVRTGATVVLVPGDGLPADASWETSIAVRADDHLLLSVERRTPLGAAPLDEAVVPVTGGQPGEPVWATAGQLRLPAGRGVWLAAAETPDRLKVSVPVLAFEGGPIALVDGPGEHGAPRTLLLRIDATPLHRLMGVAARAGAIGILDAGSVLQDGAPSDLPPAARAVRAQRVVHRLLAAGYPVAGCRVDARWYPAPSTTEPLQLLTGARALTATAVRVEWDNRAARLRLLDRIGSARASIELQSYQVEDGPAVREIEVALARAAARGVVVRVLADAVWSARGAVDRLDPVLARLARSGTVLVRLARPLPDRVRLVDLKLRDHRKLLVFDGVCAIVGGRNLGEPYLRGFDEVPLWAHSPHHDVPWLDAGAEVEGEVVARLREAFEEAWSVAPPLGPEPTVVVPPTPAAAPGDIDVRLVLHEGLRDAHSLDLTREVIDGAARSLSLVNTFPLQFELIEALMRALRRGVAVRALVGNVRPLHSDRRPFPGGGVRDLANEVIHGRLDLLVSAGASVFEYARPPQPGWDPAIGAVLPHVHAKLLSADGARFTIGSANLDITAAYWESEVVLLVESARATTALDGQLDALFATSIRVDAADPAWRQRAGRRRWLSRNWPASIG